MIIAKKMSRADKIETKGFKNIFFGLCPQNDTRRAQGFTLAEVLITLGIIGVVAALTVPTLIANNQKKQYVTQLKQVYSQLSEAMKLMMVDEGVNKVSDTNILTCQDGEDYNSVCTPRAGAFLNKYFKVIKNCGTDFDKKCFATGYYSIGKSNRPNVDNNFYRVVISNGASIAISPATDIGSGTFLIDVNGQKKPNIFGRDFFSFAFYYDGSIDAFNITPECKQSKAQSHTSICKGRANNAQEARDDMFNNDCFPGYQYGNGCFAKILNDGWKMDY